MTAIAHATEVDFRVLGPLAATSEGGELKLGGPKQRLVLAMLLAADGRAVSTDALIDGLWPDEGPATARKTLQGYVHHLRSQIGDPLHTEKGGYSLIVADSRVDGRRFTTATTDAHALLDIDPMEASGQLADALALWRGKVYADLDGEPVLRPEITRLSELRLRALADRIDADLAMGRHEVLVGELESLTVEYPLRERFRAQHMLTLYRSGRQGEALRVYARTRDHFVEEMGIEPTSELSALEEAILQRDPALDLTATPPARDDAAGTTRAVRGYELREPIHTDEHGTLYRGFQRSIGREVTVRVLESALVNDPSFVARYAEDTARLALIDSLHVAQVHDAWREPGRFYQVSPWLGGDRLDRHEVLRAPGGAAALRVMGQVGEALGAAHRAGVAHGDVRTGTVVVQDSGDAVLTDFVVGRAAGSDAEDRHAFVAMAHELVTGFAPAVTDGEYLPPSDMDTAVASVFAEAFAGESPPTERLTADLHRALGHDAVALGRDTPPPRSTVRNPYKGLRAFQQSEAGDFFGRDELVARMRAALDVNRLVAVVGPSGSGKSSAVRAGLVPVLVADGSSYLVTDMYPGAYPFEELAQALAKVALRPTPIAETLLRGDDGLLRVLAEILPDDDTELVLVIDQFEELFSMVTSAETVSLFLDNLAAATSDPHSRLRVVLALRADFFARPLEYPAFGPLVEAGLVPVSAPGPAGLAASVEGPAEAVGLEFEPGLATRIVDDVSAQSGGLPLLQHALVELVERRSSNRLTHEGYVATGGVLGALSGRAEDLWTGLPTEGRVAIRQTFLRLVSTADDARFVRRRVHRSELDALDVDHDALTDALQRFAAHRLLTFDADPTSRQPTVEVAHEALLGEWERLHSWLDEQRDDLVFRRRLHSAIAEWDGANHDPEYLLTGARLAELDAWAGGSDLVLNIHERAFIEASREQNAILEDRRARRRRQVLVAFAIAAAIATAFGIYAWVQRNDASREAFDAETARLASDAAFQADTNPQVALLMAVEAHRRDGGVVGLSALQRTLVGAGPFLGVLGAGDAYSDVHWVTDDRLLAASGDELHVIDTRSGEVVVLPVDLGAPAVGAAVSGETKPPTTGIRATSPSGVAAVATADGSLVLVDVHAGSTRELPAVARNGRAVAITSEGTRIAVGDDAGIIRILDVASGAELASTTANPVRTVGELQLDDGVYLNLPAAELEGVSWLRFDASGTRLVSAGGVFLRAWDAVDLTPLGPEIVHSWGTYEEFRYAHEPRWFWFDHADPDVVVVAGDIFVTRWDMATGERVSEGTIPTGRNEPEQSGSVGGFADGGPGRAIALLSDGRVLDLAIDELTAGGITRDAPDDVVLDAHETDTNAVAVDSGARLVAVATGDGIVVGALDGRRLIADAVPIGQSVLPSLGGDGSVLAAGLVTEGIVDLGPRQPAPIPWDVPVRRARFEETDGYFRFLPAGGRDVVMHTSEFFASQSLFEFPSGQPLALAVDAAVLPSWSDDGRLVAHALSFGQSVVVETATGELVHEMAQMMRAADFSADGGQALMSTLIPRPASVTFSPGPAFLVDLASGETTPLPDMPGGVAGAAFTPDETEIVTIGGRGDVWVLGAESLERVRSLDPADTSTEAGAQLPVFSTDGEWMFSAADGVARVWHVETGLQLGAPLPSQAGGLPHAVAQGDVLRVVTPLEGNALVWNLDPVMWVDIACRAAGRNMTADEWALFGPRDASRAASCPQYPLVPVAAEFEATATVEPVGADAALPGSGLTVTVGRADWSSGYFQAAVFAALLEELGYTVTDPAVNEQSPTDAYISMAAGAVDFWPNGWYPQHQFHHDRTLDDGTRLGDNLVVLGQELVGAGLQGLVIGSDVADANGITSLAQIAADPGLAALFDIDGNGLGDISGCPESWTCDDVIDEMIDRNGWTTLEQFKGDTYGEMFDATLSRVEAGEAAIQYTWSPSGHLARLIPGENVRWLSLGGQELALDGSGATGLQYDDAAPARMGARCTEDPCWLGWYVEDIRVTANADFASANPAAVALFEVVKLDPLAIAAQNDRYDAGASSEADVRQEARLWIGDNRPVVDEWLAYALAATR
ncbi:MAG: BTAD domain-containing putative transcriptional regulator [Acidimicrobiales bacterium]